MIVAIVPAAGRSARMNRPKLLLPIAGIPLIARVIAALREGGADRVVVVTANVPGSDVLKEISIAEQAEVVVAPEPPPDMRASIERGIASLEGGPEPSAVLIAPGDSPGLNALLVRRVIDRSAHHPGRILVPSHDGRRGHPLLLPWSLVQKIPRLPEGVGVNALLVQHAGAILELDTDDPGILADLDTPDDYRRWSSHP